LDLKNLNPFISDQRWSRSRTAGVKQNFWLYAMSACTEWYSTHQIRWNNWRI